MTTEKTLATDGYYHYIYKITIPETGQYYYGQHSLKAETYIDNYMGSGTDLNKIYELSGFNCASKEICMYADSFEELDQLENDIIGDKYKTDPLCLNKVPGGRSTGLRESRVLGGIAAQKKNRQLNRNIFKDWYDTLSLEEKEKFRKQISNVLKEYYKTHKSTWLGKHHSADTIKKMQKPKPMICGENNGNYGNHWIYNNTYRLSISVPDILFWDYIAEGWIKGRKIKFDNDYIPHKEKVRIKKEKKLKIKKELNQNKYLELKEILKVYEKYGFDKVVEVFNYKYTRNNLVQQFKKYIPYPEYIPNKNTRRFK